jgi:hypothetical protein
MNTIEKPALRLKAAVGTLLKKPRAVVQPAG